ncbi:hypothetical protein KIW84_066285 [Lathyrus oleraceus]|uniref:DUF7745 domain-containing protein n=1 Tax=Pisum sativum TaxID=3888 RepID=A0A9D4WHC5_PEA|nr:hypothetical protein KIW84_066285 [Pisum sativum]
MGLSKNKRNSLNYKYGRILDLLTVHVQQEALTTLAQFYDPTIRCFQFQDFQLAPTIEEFNKILEILKPKKDPFNMIRVRGDFKGFSKDFLEGKAANFETSLRWDILDNLMILLIFGLVLFPTEEEFMDYASINMFVAVKVRDEDLILALLADVYDTLHQRHRKKGYSPIAPRALVPIMISMEEGNTLNTTILQLRKEKEELEEKFYKTTCEKNQLNRDLNQVVDLKRQMNLIEEAYDEMREWGTYVDGHNQAVTNTIEEDKAIMLNLQKKLECHRERYLKLVILSNDLIDEIPRSLKEDEYMMNIFKPYYVTTWWTILELGLRNVIRSLLL